MAVPDKNLAYGAQILYRLQQQFGHLLNVLNQLTADMPEKGTWERLLEEMAAIAKAIGEISGASDSLEDCKLEELVAIRSVLAMWPLAHALLENLIRGQAAPDRQDQASSLLLLLLRSINPSLSLHPSLANYEREVAEWQERKLKWRRGNER